MSDHILLLLVAIGMAAGATGFAQPYHKTSETVDYKCLFNHELLIVCSEKENNAQLIAAFVDKLKDTEVDVVMCCPTAWRTNVFPSEVDPQWKKYTPDQTSPKFKSFDYIMKYIHSGGDPVKDTLEACRRCGKDFFISYRMNDPHFIEDRAWPTHNFIWREHPEYWLGDTDASPYSKDNDNARLLNYMIPEVREYYFAIIEELCTKYDVDGVELDLQRCPKFFHTDKTADGTPVMTAFVKRIRDMLNRIGKERGKSLKLCARLPQTIDKCEKAGLDVCAWDAQGLMDMLNISSYFIHSIELDIEGFKARTKHAKIYGEMNYVTYQMALGKRKYARRYTTIEIYRASALNLLCRGADGLSLFNYDYVPKQYRLPMTEGLKRIMDVDYLRTMPKDYVVTRGFGTFPAKDEKTVELIIPDDTAKVKFERAILRVETKERCADLHIGVWLNGKPLDLCAHDGTELFPPVEHNAAVPLPGALKFYVVPLDLLVPGMNKVEIKNLDKEKTSCMFCSLEIALYR